MRLILTSPSGDRWQLDTPDPALAGTWLKAIFDDLALRDHGGPYIPITFELEIR